MATVGQRKYTPEDLLKIHSRPMPELVDGELVQREMGLESDGIAATIIYFLMAFVRAGKLGFVQGSQGSYQIFPDHPKRVRIPDVSFIRRDRLDPGWRRTRGHGRIAPDLVVEVVSPNDTIEKFEGKLRDYHSAGIPLIWVVYPDTKVVRVHEAGQIRELRVGDLIDGGEVLPGFECEVASFFE